MATRKSEKPTSLREVVAKSNGRIIPVMRPESQGTVRLTLRPGRKR
jgi:hypothetical protein